MNGELPMWVVYERPRDFPSGYVVRRQVVMRDYTIKIGEEATYHATLEEARQAMPPGLHRLPRFEEDDVAILEAWL